MLCWRHWQPFANWECTAAAALAASLTALPSTTTHHHASSCSQPLPRALVLPRREVRHAVQRNEPGSDQAHELNRVNHDEHGEALLESAPNDHALSKSRLENASLALNAFSSCVILAAHVTAPKQLPHSISPENHPYIDYTRRRPSSSILHNRYIILPPATAHMQNAAICAATRYKQTGQPATQTWAGQAPSGSCGGRLTVVPQMTYKGFRRVGRGRIPAGVRP
jgi:hypothetical protein